MPFPARRAWLFQPWGNSREKPLAEPFWIDDHGHIDTADLTITMQGDAV